jgi:glycosyltransferase involved in cell wall biosynthesis
MSGRLFFWTDIPTPYRVSLYNKLKKNKLNFEVWYTKSHVISRYWRITNFKFKHNYILGRPIYFFLNKLSYHFFFSPLLIFKAIKLQKIDDLILALSWNDFNVFIIIILKKLGLLKARICFWSEANYLTFGARNDYWLKTNYRKWIYNSIDGFELSAGYMTKLTFEKWGINKPIFIDFPNTIEEDKFFLNKKELNSRLKNKKPTILIAARLIEKYKGIMNFFEKLGLKQIKLAKFLIAGDGFDRIKLVNYITINKLDHNIILLGNISSPKELRLVYAKSNIFCLPSFSDSSPLVVIEALKMKLPLLISSRCGNHFEAVREDYNGFIFNPSSKKSVQRAFHKMIEVYKKKIFLKKFCEESENIFNKKFALHKVINNFKNEYKKYKHSY